MRPVPEPLKKPSLRGYFHQEAFFVSLGACSLLMVHAGSSLSRMAAIIYSFGLLFLFGVSAVYHRPHWEPRQRALLKRFDHSAIFVLIASTFTPFALIALPGPSGERLLAVIWAAATAGILQSIFWVKAPKWFTAIFYVAVGWLIYPYTAELNASLGTAQVIWIYLGGLIYTAGAVFYALKRPVLNPKFFGYHELFHVFTIIAAAIHFSVIYALV